MQLEKSPHIPRKVLIEKSITFLIGKDPLPIYTWFFAELPQEHQTMSISKK